MSHLLAKMHGAHFPDSEKSLKAVFLEHTAEGIFLEHLWKNREHEDEVLFPFRTMNLERAKKYLNKVNMEAIKKDPAVELPEFTFLEGN